MISRVFLRTKKWSNESLPYSLLGIWPEGPSFKVDLESHIFHHLATFQNREHMKLMERKGQKRNMSDSQLYHCCFFWLNYSCKIKTFFSLTLIENNNVHYLLHCAEIVWVMFLLLKRSSKKSEIGREKIFTTFNCNINKILYLIYWIHTSNYWYFFPHSKVLISKRHLRLLFKSSTSFELM